MTGSPDERPLRLALLGLGLVGGSVGLAARARLGAHVVGWDPDPAARAEAVERGAVDEVVADAGELASHGEFDVALVAAPVHALGATIALAAEHCPGAVVTDVGSIKNALAAGGHGGRYIGGHPLAGAEVAGIAHARADLFDGATWYLTPRADSEGVLLERLHRFVAGLGAVPAVIDHAEHDRLMAVFSHVPHVVANVLVTQALSALGGEVTPVVGPSFRDATRVAGANPALWGGIYEANREAIVVGIDSVIEGLSAARELAAGADRDQLAAWQTAAAADRTRLLDIGMTGGQLRELRVVVPNRPGVIAELALTLGRAGINIQDMSLQPRTDNRSGEVALWVDEAHAEKAIELVASVASSTGDDQLS